MILALGAQQPNDRLDHNGDRTMRCHVLTVCLCMMGLAGCETLESQGDGKTVTLTLTRQDDGSLQYCDAEGNCQSRANPNDCAVLEIDIDTVNGESCERCFDAAGDIVHQSCGETSVACAVITFPEPDCVVCAYIDGAILFSSCVPEEPECDDVVDPSGIACKRCRDASGRTIYDDCPDRCDLVMCAQVLCAEGFHPERIDGGCCDTCVPDLNCDEIACTTLLPACPDGSQPFRDPAHCCGWLCEPTECPVDLLSEASSGVEPMCAPGYLWSEEFPHCGACIPDPARHECYSTLDCAPGEFCSVELGDCFAPSNSDLAVCVGVCLPYPICDQTAPAHEDQPVADSCQGVWETRYDADGCPRLACVCPDGSVSLDGVCHNSCEQVACFAPPPECGPGYHLVTDYPHCCGICVPDTCLVATGQDPARPVACPQVLCAPGYHPEPGPNCCDVCVRDEVMCLASEECAEHEQCSTERGDCRSLCEPNDGMTCPAVCAGICEPLRQCEDSDGINPKVAGVVHLTAANGDVDVFEDQCAEDGLLVIEAHCVSSVDADGRVVQSVAHSVFACEHGCAAGACASQ